MQTEIGRAAHMAVAGQQFPQVLGCEIVFAHGVVRRCQPKPGLLHVIAIGDQGKGLSRTRIVLAKARGADCERDLAVGGRQSLGIFVMAQRGGHVAALQCGNGTVAGILRRATLIGAHPRVGLSSLAVYRDGTLPTRC